MFRLRSLACALVVLAGLTVGTGAAQAAPTELFFSEYVEGSSNNKALEIYNGTGASIDLTAAGYSVQMFFNGSATAGLTINLAGTVAAGDVFVVAQSSASAPILAQADQTNGSGWFNGDDAVVLRRGAVVIDSIGQVGFDPGTEWGSSLTSTADNTLRRRLTVGGGDTDASNTFAPADEWDGFAVDTFDGLGAHGSSETAPRVESTSPTAGAGGVARDANVTITFSEPVLAGSNAFAIACSASGAHPANVSGGPTTFTLDPSTNFSSGETCTVTVDADGVSDLDAIDPPDTMTADHTFGFTVADVFACGDPATRIHQIQGTGSTAARTGSQTIEGVVVGDYQGSGQFGGYFVQEEAGDQDGDALTSEGIFVFNTSFPVSVGEVVRVRGTAGEFGGMTQLSSVNAFAQCGTGSVPPTPVALPVEDVAHHERYEGMLVRYDQTLTATEVFNLGRFGEVILSGVGRLYHPTASATPGPASLAVAARNANSRIVLDDGSNTQNNDPTRYPQDGLSATNTLRVGDSLAGLTGVLEFRFSAYRIQPVGPIEWSHTNPRPPAPAPVGGNLKIASFNVLNYFNDFLCGDRCRGAESTFEFERQEAKIVSALKTIDADVVGLMEIENDGGPGNALAELTNALNEATAPGTYAFVDTGVIGTDAIKVALIYKPASVAPVGPWDILTSADDSRFVDTRNRPALAQTFRHRSSGEAITVAVNHLKSKGSGCGGAPDDQPDALGGNCNGTRTLAASALADWLNGDPTGSGDPDALIIGDLNAYTFETPIQELEARGFTNLVWQFQGSRAYSYVFRGESGYLDHALANAALGPQVVGVTEWHINPDEPAVLDYNTNFKSANHVTSLYDSGPYRSSDHDPVIVGLQLNHAPVADAGGPYSVPEGGSVLLDATGSSDVEGDALTYTWDLDGDGDFDDAAGATPAFSAAAIDGPATRTVRVRAADATRASVASATVTVTNVAPTASFVAPASAPAGFGFALALANADDPAPADEATLQYAFDCGSGYGAWGAAGTASCTPTTPGAASVGGKVRDDDGGVTEYRRTVQVTVTFASLCELVRTYSDKQGIADALCAKLDAARAKAERKDQEAELRSFVNHVQAQSGKAFTTSEAATLIRLAGNL